MNSWKDPEYIGQLRQPNMQMEPGVIGASIAMWFLPMVIAKSHQVCISASYGISPDL